MTMLSPPSALFLLVGVGMMAVGVIAVLAWRRRTGAPWIAFGLGALAWTVGVALKFGWSLPMNPIIRQALDRVLPSSASAPVYWLYIGLLTGVFECGAALPLVMRTRLRAAGWDQAVAFGIGFGALEAFLIGMVQFLAILAAILIWDQFPEDAQTAFSQPPITFGIVYIPLPVAERVSALVAHVFAGVLIVYGVGARQQRWFWLSFAYMTALDAFSAWALLATEILNSMPSTIAFEAAVGVFAAVGLVGLAFLRGRFRGLAESTGARAPAPGRRPRARQG
jgi:uncharacterized membrane protein YhfC